MISLVPLRMFVVARRVSLEVLQSDSWSSSEQPAVWNEGGARRSNARIKFREVNVTP